MVIIQGERQRKREREREGRAEEFYVVFDSTIRGIRRRSRCGEISADTRAECWKNRSNDRPNTHTILARDSPLELVHARTLVKIIYLYKIPANSAGVCAWSRRFSDFTRLHTWYLSFERMIDIMRKINDKKKKKKERRNNIDASLMYWTVVFTRNSNCHSNGSWFPWNLRNQPKVKLTLRHHVLSSLSTIIFLRNFEHICLLDGHCLMRWCIYGKFKSTLQPSTFITE